MEVITSSQNRKVRWVLSLKKKEQRKEEGLFLIEGPKMLEEAQKSNVEIEMVLFDPAGHGGLALRAMAEQCEQGGAQALEVNAAIMRAVCDTVTPQGILAVCREKNMLSLAQNEAQTVLILDRIRDPGNVGTIIRCAEGLGIDQIIAIDCADIYAGKVVRSTMGSIFRQNVRVCGGENTVIEELRQNRYKMYAAVLRENSVPIDALDFSGRVAVIIGNEANGVDEALLPECDALFHIPMRPSVESFNAATSAAIVMWEMQKNRGDKDDR